MNFIYVVIRKGCDSIVLIRYESGIKIMMRHILDYFL
jgi:hypothetical protein